MTATNPTCRKCGSRTVKGGYNKYKTTIYQCANKKCKYRSTYTTNKGGRPKTLGKCLLCENPAFAKDLCRKCYRKQYWVENRA